MPKAAKHRGTSGQVITVNEAAFVAGVSPKTVNQAIDREQIRARELPQSTDRAQRGLDASDAVYLSVREVLAPTVWPRLYRFLHGKPLSELPAEFEVDGVVLNLERVIQEVHERFRLLGRMAERVETDPEVRSGEPVFRGTRTPVYAIARKIALGSTTEELREDYPQLEEGDLELATQYARVYPPRGRPRTDWARPARKRGVGGRA